MNIFKISEENLLTIICCVLFIYNSIEDINIFKLEVILKFKIKQIKELQSTIEIVIRMLIF